MPTDTPPDSVAPIVIVRTWPVAPDLLWELWTTAAGFASWWGPQGFRADVHALEAWAGGRLHYDMVAATPEMVSAMEAAGQPTSHPVQARFGDFEPTSRLSIVSVIDFLPGVPVYQSTVDVRLQELAGSTRMTVTLSPMHAPAFSRMQAEGFTSQLTKLEARFGPG